MYHSCSIRVMWTWIYDNNHESQLTGCPISRRRSRYELRQVHVKDAIFKRSSTQSLFYCCPCSHGSIPFFSPYSPWPIIQVY